MTCRPMQAEPDAALRGENRASPRLGAGGQGSSSAELSVLPPPPRKTKSAASLLLGERRRLPLALFFFRAHQAVPQPEVDALLFQKFLVGALFLNALLAQHKNAV